MIGVKDSAFVKTFGKSPRIQVLDFLLNNNLLDYCKADIAEQTAISRSTLDTFWNNLIKNKIIIKSRRIGRAELYKLNKKLPIVQKLIELGTFLTKEMKLK